MQKKYFWTQRIFEATELLIRSCHTAPSSCCNAWLPGHFSALTMGRNGTNTPFIFDSSSKEMYCVSIMFFPSELLIEYFTIIGAIGLFIRVLFSDWLWLQGWQGLWRHVPESGIRAEFCNCNKINIESNNGYHEGRPWHMFGLWAKVSINSQGRYQNPYILQKETLGIRKVSKFPKKWENEGWL